jgi:hypothetical protein
MLIKCDVVVFNADDSVSDAQNLKYSAAELRDGVAPPSYSTFVAQFRQWKGIVESKVSGRDMYKHCSGPVTRAWPVLACHFLAMIVSDPSQHVGNMIGSPPTSYSTIC